MSQMNIGSFEKVDYLNPTMYRYVNVRGYGGIHEYTVTDSKMAVNSHPYNRLENLGPHFGQHLPKDAEEAYVKANPQTTIAWR